MIFLKNIYELELKIDQFLNLTSECGILFEQFIKLFVLKKLNECEIKVNKVRENERLADELRIQIEKYVYSHTLIPENRGDVLAILEGTDEVIDQIKEIIIDMLIEKPFIPDSLYDDFKDLAVSSSHSVEELSKSVRSFFYNVHEVANSVNKVLYFEKEADDIAEKIKKELYQADIELAVKNHLKYYVKGVEKISDYAQDVADRLTIYTLKREP
ncbi:MAG: DUF47 family protein [Candidatus Cloacimonetes bacterium]|nr:DUF47 family protein [Candidatus Cloacimonadota bacterium]